MANVKISQLPAATVPLTGTEVYPLVQGGVTAKAVVAVPFLTPQMFGAVGDGTTDDTSAITSAFASAATLKRPLFVTGGLAYAVDSVPLLSNLTVLGDGNTIFKLKANAAGSVFVWPQAATTDNVTFRDLIFDGNIANQPGAPHNLIHSIFFGADNTCQITNSVFENLYAHDIDGMLFGANGFGLNPIFYDSIFRDINIFHFAQSNFSIDAHRCLFENIKADNTTMTQVNIPSAPGSGAAGFNAKCTECTIRGVRAWVSTTVQPGTTPVGVVAGQGFFGDGTLGNNVYDDCDVYCNNTDRVFGYTLDTASNDKYSNLRSHDCRYNADFEFFRLTNCTFDNIQTINSSNTAPCFSVIIDGCSGLDISGLEFQSPNQSQDSLVFSNAVYSDNSNINIDGYILRGSFGCRLDHVSKLTMRNGIFLGVAVPFHNDTTGVQRGLIDGVQMDGVSSWAWQLKNSSYLTISNVFAQNMTNEYFIQDPSCTNIRYVNLAGISFERAGSGNIRGFFDGNNKVVAFYDFAVQGGTIGTHGLGVTLPKGTYVRSIWYTVTDPAGLTSSSNTATVALGTVADNQAFKNATIVTDGSWTYANPTYGKISPSSSPTGFFFVGSDTDVAVTVAVQNLTNGQIEIHIDYERDFT